MLIRRWNGQRVSRVVEGVNVAMPDDLRDLLDRPLYAALGTIRPNSSVQVNPMWFDFDGEHVRFAHTTYRAK